MSLAPGLAALLFVRSPRKERAERMARSRLRDPPASQAGSPHAVREFQRHTSGGSARRVRSIELNRGLGSSFSPAFRTRMDLSACWMSPGSVAIADFPPFVRADARTFTRAVRSLCRGLPRPSPGQPIPETSEASKAREPPRPVPRRMTIAARSVSVRDAEQNIPSRMKVNKLRK